MICGIYHKDRKRSVLRESIEDMIRSSILQKTNKNLEVVHNIGVGFGEQYPGECFYFSDQDKNTSLLFQGKIYNSESLSHPIKETTHNGLGDYIIKTYSKIGERFIEKFRGKFSLMLYDRRLDRFILARDRFGIEPLFYFEDKNSIIFSSSINAILAHPNVTKRLNINGLCQYLLFCYNPSYETLFQGIQKCPPGSFITSYKHHVKVNRYWKLSFADILSDREERIEEDLQSLLMESVKIRLSDAESGVGIFLSGGMDSSTVVALTNSLKNQKINTFSYRCRGESFDESSYAKFVADYFKTKHHLVEYKPESIFLIHDMVEAMDEPFCDVGINIATELLGKFAADYNQTILTGDGGDELFGGHPIYLADPIGRLIDRFPGFIKNPFLWAGSRLPDSKKKKDIWVKWKRFSLSIQFPADLLSHRWRIYYTPQELRALVHPDLYDAIRDEKLYQTMLQFNAEADGVDTLSRSIYSDYQTVVGFYLRRMDLIRRYGIETRFPLLDHKLVEYCARIPSHLKIRNRSDSKYILKRTMENLLPREIVYRKDKLGHSIPLKNWMRDNQEVCFLFQELLSERNIKKRGIFNWDIISMFVNEHGSMKRNHSHRLWALVVLEIWLRKYFNA